jgi:hypothetical protein
LLVGITFVCWCSLFTIPKQIMSSADMLRGTTSGKLSAMKQKVSQATVGPVIKATGKHADGMPVRLLLQVGSTVAAALWPILLCWTL